MGEPTTKRLGATHALFGQPSAGPVTTIPLGVELPGGLGELAVLELAGLVPEGLDSPLCPLEGPVIPLPGMLENGS